jgi:phenylacetate-coenzyme A ligase PaaK-like adenylate-forming protein
LEISSIIQRAQRVRLTRKMSLIQEIRGQVHIDIRIKRILILEGKIEGHLLTHLRQSHKFQISIRSEATVNFIPANTMVI